MIEIDYIQYWLILFSIQYVTLSNRCVTERILKRTNFPIFDTHLNIFVNGYTFHKNNYAVILVTS